MEGKQLTIWQELTSDFGSNSLLNQDIPVFKFEKKELLKTTDKASFEKAKLELQQSLYLKNNWVKIENNLYTQSVYYEPTRLASYYDYESMEYTPEISSALDTFSEESTTPDQNGEILQIYSESKRVRNLLKTLFYKNLDINTNLPMWTRNTCKYGDNFVYLKIDKKRGITGCLQLPNIEIERIEKGIRKRKEGVSGLSEEPKEMRFSWKNKNMDFLTWEIAHFRLLGDDRKLPYGTSILEKARRIWKQLILAEDAMLIYRTSRAPERRVFKVFVGNMDDKDVQPYVQRFANRFKRDSVQDSKTGNVDLRFNQMAVDQDYFVPVRDISAPNPIETLPGASNLDAIADIEYIQKKLLTALRMPKTFLGFEEVVADGKNLALQDIRFARTINKVQKNMIAELNKIAIIHLMVSGFKDEIGNFTLGLTNPSTQADLMKVDVMREKMNLYKDAVTSVEGIAPMSHSSAKKHILNMSEEEIRIDILEQRIDRAVANELQNTPNVIPKTGIFEPVDKIYGLKIPKESTNEPTPNMNVNPQLGSGGGMNLGGGGGSADFNLGGGGSNSIGDIDFSEFDNDEAANPQPDLQTPESPKTEEDNAEKDDEKKEVFPESVDDMISIKENATLLNSGLEINLDKSRYFLEDISKKLNELLDD